MADSSCLLEWHPYAKDRTMGLNHQLASLSCALAEAHHLGRTLVLPPSMCLFGLHTERWSGSDAPGGRCVPMGDLFDLDLLSRLVPVVLGPIENRTSPQQLRGAVDVRRGLKSAEVASQHPCARAPVVRRRVDNFWFTMCSKRIADSDSIMGALHAALGSPPSAKRREPATEDALPLDPSAGSRTPPPPPLPRPLNVLLRSGLFYSQRIKRAVRAVQRSIGGASGRWDPADSDSLRALSREYYSVHVRRSDKLTACDVRQQQAEQRSRGQLDYVEPPKDVEVVGECKVRDQLTRPEGLRHALSLWFPEQSRVYIGSTERPDFFAPLRSSFRLFFAEDFGRALANVSNNYELYAVETLLFFGSSGTVETLGYAASWVQDACFPAARLRAESRADRRAARMLPHHANGSGGVRVECVDRFGLVANGVRYGPACVDNPPCGKAMPPPCRSRDV